MGTDHEAASDLQLVAAAQAGDERALERLLSRYRALALGRARRYFLPGGDPEDLAQEAMIGLCHAVAGFDRTRQSGFRAFAALCVDRQLVSAVRAATRHKHNVLTHALSLHRPVPGGEDAGATLAELLPAPPLSDPAELVESAEAAHALREHLAAVLSDLESEVLRLHVAGRSHQDIAGAVQRHTKAVDNALRRVRHKVHCYLQERHSRASTSRAARSPARTAPSM